MFCFRKQGTKVKCNNSLIATEVFVYFVFLHQGTTNPLCTRDGRTVGWFHAASVGVGGVGKRSTYAHESLDALRGRTDRRTQTDARPERRGGGPASERAGERLVDARNRFGEIGRKRE